MEHFAMSVPQLHVTVHTDTCMDLLISISKAGGQRLPSTQAVKGQAQWLSFWSPFKRMPIVNKSPWRCSEGHLRSMYVPNLQVTGYKISDYVPATHRCDHSLNGWSHLYASTSTLYQSFFVVTPFTWQTNRAILVWLTSPGFIEGCSPSLWGCQSRLG